MRSLTSSVKKPHMALAPLLGHADRVDSFHEVVREVVVVIVRVAL